MLLPRTYRLRLVVYIAVLLVFLAAVLAFSYHGSRALILQEAEDSINRVAQQIEGQLGYHARDSRARVKMIRDNVPLTEYLFIANALDTDAAAIRELYQRQFGWLPADRVVLLMKNGKTMLGAGHVDLIQALRARRALDHKIEQQFYLYGKNGLELVSAAPVEYRSQYLGMVAITAAISDEWMKTTRELSNGHLLMVKDGKIIQTTLGNKWTGHAFNPASNALRVGNEEFLVRQIQVAGAKPDLPTLWFALSEMELTQRINKQRNQVLALAVTGCIGILLIGFLMLRNFSAPLGRLITIINEVSDGRFPDFRETDKKDEIGFLWNRFAEMVRVLRDKQEELATVHQQLEKQAITDALTGLYNRRYLYDIYPKLWSEALRQGGGISVILIDLDHFKSINDRFGHPTGDRVLVHVANKLRESCRVSDFVFRMGGEEFIVLTHAGVEGAQVLAEKMRSALEHSPVNEGQFAICVTASFGVAQADETDGLNGLSQTLARADKALYAAKQDGRNRVACWEAPRLVVSKR